MKVAENTRYVSRRASHVRWELVPERYGPAINLYGLLNIGQHPRSIDARAFEPAGYEYFFRRRRLLTSPRDPCDHTARKPVQRVLSQPYQLRASRAQASLRRRFSQ
ncbi:hypothetical protein SAMN05444320_10792 [Streptoalloteichus hindustanus]|uniref:Uncharacterized protein n=1 Tax=Streptoalloteichus hindustanus TaxID=2017 RepID=A0A1M5I422_STRHI|nr:hypothetical protein SAMN05444320_10792 [Streptoalloteichus hindustanus]